MNIIVPRTCIEIPPRDEAHNREQEPCLLAAFRSVPAYVLLGDPGSGKTTAFEVEREALGENACLITARDFLALNMDSHPERPGKTLFIDGLDEVRAGTADVRTPFDAIRGRLGALGKPRFRLSCREADWLGANDRDHLASVSLDGTVTVLRLDPLTDVDIVTILDAQSEIDDAQRFVEKARERGVDGLLKNPQSLELLVKAVADGGWPESRLDTFESACRQMIRDCNDDHRAARRESLPDQLLSNAAGRLCAVQLMTGIAGYTVGLGESDSAYPSPEECGGDIEHGVYRAALATMLFKAESDDTRLVSVHRHIAEFLGARYLSQLIDKGLPIQRILALITGEDGGVVTEMRGLSAWLAAQCQSARIDLIERDPIGVGLYGDLHQFSHDEKRALLNALKHEVERLGLDIESQYWISAFGPLTTPDMEQVLREILTDPARDEQHQMLVVFVLRILEAGIPLSGLSDLLLGIVRDATRSPSVNALALHTFLHTCPAGQDKTDTLKRLLADIQAEQVTGPDNELAGILLSWLYPQDLPASQVWNYLSEPRDSDLRGSHIQFWGYDLLEKSSDKDVLELLDGLQGLPPGLHPAPGTPRPYLENLPLKLLARGLNAYGDRIPTEQLYDWLGVGLLRTQYKLREETRKAQVWLEQHPAIQKAILTEGVRRYTESDDESFSRYMSEVERRLYGANPPSDFGPWCAQQAIAATDSQVAEYFIVRASHAGLPLESQLEQAHGHRDLQSRISRMMTQRDRDEAEYQEREGQRQSYTEERKRQENEWLAYVRSNEAALRENRAAPALLDELAKAYFRNFFSNDHDGPEAVEKELRGDQSLTQAALQGLRSTPDRSDVPELEAILSLREKGRIHCLELPFLAGLAEIEGTPPEIEGTPPEIEGTPPEDAAQWDNGRIRKALAFYYCRTHGDYRPKWYRRLLKARPEAVAEVQVRFAVSEFRSDSESIYKLRELAHDPEHAQVARYASLPLLRAFPTRCKLKHINALDHMLWAAIQHADRAPFKKLIELIERKLSRTSMSHAQRVHWLTAGLVVSPKRYRERLKDLVRDREKQVQQVVHFFYDFEWEPPRYELGIPVPLEISAVELLIHIIGSHIGPELWPEGGFVRSAMEAPRLVHTYIRHLATSPAKDASDALASLRSDPTLTRWYGELSWAWDSQQVIRRDAEYRHPDAKQVCQTLRDGPPANAADLAALVMDRLREIAVQIRTGNTDDWRQYWNENSYGRPCSPKPENSCRDALLSDLRQRLPHGADAQPEGEYANDRRSDIRVSCRDFQVPVEVKRNKHRELWRACKDQLIKQYTSDPATNGYGIYLVFWFGKDHTQPPPSGTRPDSPTVLEEQLKATLSEDGARKISVCVIDVSNPKE